MTREERKQRIRDKYKEMVIDPTMGHSFPAGWTTKYEKFFKERIK